MYVVDIFMQLLTSFKLVSLSIEVNLVTSVSEDILVDTLQHVCGGLL